jgi:hypothetical protein
MAVIGGDEERDAILRPTTSPHQRQTRPHCQKAARAGGVYLAGS